MTSAVYIIAEAGVNHNGDMAMARRLVDIARAAGADAVKFQTFNTDAMLSAAAPMAKYQEVGSDAVTAVEMIRQLELSHSQFGEIRDYCAETGIEFLSTPFDLESAEYLRGLGMTKFKVPSGEITNAPFIRALARMAPRMIVSTGMSTLADVEAAVSWIEDEGCRDITLLHCVSVYPARPETANLKAMDTLAHAFGYPVGWSDHTAGDAVTLAAVARGATTIEKHFTIDKSLAGPDHAMSLDPGELAVMVARIREVVSSLGDGRKRPTAEEQETIVVARRSLFMAREVAAGDVIKAEDLISLRPGDGLPPSRMAEVVGRVARRNLSAGTQVTLSDLGVASEGRR